MREGESGTGDPVRVLRSLRRFSRVGVRGLLSLGEYSEADVGGDCDGLWVEVEMAVDWI